MTDLRSRRRPREQAKGCGSKERVGERRRGAASLIGWHGRWGERRGRFEGTLSVVLDVFVHAGGDDGGRGGRGTVAVGPSSSSPSELAV